MSFISNEIKVFKDKLKSDGFKRDAYRHALLMVLALLALIPMWDASQVILYFIGATALFGISVHLMRRILFPYVDLEKFTEKAYEQPLPAAIVVFSIIMFICTMFIVTASFVGGK